MWPTLPRYPGAGWTPDRQHGGRGVQQALSDQRHLQLQVRYSQEQGKGPGAGAPGESPNQRTAVWGAGLSLGVQPVSPRPSLLQIPSFWVLRRKPQVTPMTRLPHKEHSILPRVYLFNKLVMLWEKLRIPVLPQLD